MSASSSTTTSVPLRQEAIDRVTVPLVPWAARSGGGQPSGSAYSAYVGRPPNCQSWTSTSAYSPARA